MDPESNSEHNPQSCARRILAYWRTYVVFITPFVFLPIALVIDTSEARCGYIMIVMIIFWVTEALPLPVTALLPIVLVPMFGIMPSKELCPSYTKDTIFLFIGGLVVAICVEHWNLHRRIATKALLLVGTSPRWLLFGFMITTWFLSMWISNSATTAMMLPMVAAVLEQIEKGQKSLETAGKDHFGEKDNEAFQMKEIRSENGIKTDDVSLKNSKENILSDSSDTITTEEKLEKEAASRRISKAMTMSVAYAANCGGIGTLTGTPPNLVLAKEMPSITYTDWMAFAIPVSLLSVAVAWFWLQILFLRKDTFRGCCTKPSNDAAIKRVLRAEYEKLGSISFAEVSTLVLFVILVLLWLTRSPKFIEGWGSLFDNNVSDATPAILIVIVMFCWLSAPPSCNTDIYHTHESEGPNREAPVPPLLSWQVVTHKLPWDIVLLLGGGFALADTSKKSGFSEYIGDLMASLDSLPAPAIALLVSAIIAALTEVTSNTATASIMLPIIKEMAKKIKVHPLFLMLPATVSASFAFMLPVATPPNAIVFSYGHLKIKDMAIAGLFMNIVCVLIVLLAVETWGTAYFHLDTFPEFVNATGNTTVAPLGSTTL